MKINNKEREILVLIKKKYLKILRNKTINNFTKIEAAIIAIETYNRNVIWRTFEYILFFIYSIEYFFSRKLDNLSIGRYQYKITHILDYLNIKYKLSEREITLTNLKVCPFIKILINRNKSEVLSSLFSSEKFNINFSTDILSPEVKFFIEEYSRTLSTDKGFTYYFVFINTVT